MPTFVDIHCHLLPGIDDGAKSWSDTIAMAKMAARDGIRTIITTPHQMGNFGHNQGPAIRQLVDDVQAELNHQGIALQVLPGADIRIEPDMIAQIRAGRVLSLADRHRHVLLELPHELYFPLDELLDQLEAAAMVGILSHPERNQGILQSPHVLAPLVDRGCLMQVTCGSLMGTFGPASQAMSEWLLEEGLVHFLASDAHSPRSRRPLMRRAFERAAELVGDEVAEALCCRNPAAVAAGRVVPPLPRRRASAKRFNLKRLLPWKRAA